MGNCINQRGYATAWTDDNDDDWISEQEGSLSPTRDQQQHELEEEEEKDRVRPATATEVKIKIKITKKELEELLRSVGSRGLTVQQVLEDLVAMGDCAEHGHHWRPALQSIPE